MPKKLFYLYLFLSRSWTVLASTKTTAWLLLSNGLHLANVVALSRMHRDRCLTTHKHHSPEPLPTHSSLLPPRQAVCLKTRDIQLEGSATCQRPHRSHRRLPRGQRRRKGHRSTGMAILSRRRPRHMFPMARLRGRVANSHLLSRTTCLRRSPRADHCRLRSGVGSLVERGQYHSMASSRTSKQSVSTLSLRARMTSALLHQLGSASRCYGLFRFFLLSVDQCSLSHHSLVLERRQRSST